jgi:hypothetical protein
LQVAQVFTLCGNISAVWTPLGIVECLVAEMRLGPPDSFIPRRIFRRLVRCASTENERRGFISETVLQSTSFRADGIGYEVWLQEAA